MKKTKLIGKSQHIAIIGYGRFGSLLEKIIGKINPEIPIKVYSQGLTTDNNRFFSLGETVRGACLIIPAIPINQFESICREIKPLLPSGTTIIDVCSVMEYSVEVMQDVFKNKPDVNLIASHPMFGPTAWKKRGKNLKALTGLNLVINNVRCLPNIYKQIKQFLQELHLNVIEITPEEHDRLVAQSQFFAQLIRQIASDLSLKRTFIDTPSAAKIFEGIELMADSKELFLDMLHFNRFARDLLFQINHEVDELIRSL